MIRQAVYETQAGQDAEGIAYRLHGMCKVGAAASDTVLDIDLHKGGWTDMFEVMAGLCDQLVMALEAEKLARRERGAE